ncbi:hypothetical protein ACHAPJ_006287 [Fusarium lateritium]
MAAGAAKAAEAAPISSKAAACLSLFDRCIAMAANVDAHRQSAIEDQVARFSIWTSNMAVFAKSKLSLDHRLRWTPQVRDLVTGLLGVLEGCVQQLISVLERFGHSELSVPARNQLLAGGDFERALSALSGELTLLNELSNTIRKASRKAQDENALSEFIMKDVDGNSLEVVLHKAWADNLLDRFPGCSDAIRERLATAMVLRRKKILYRRSRYSGDPLRSLQTTDKPALRPLPNRQEDEVQQPLQRRGTGPKLNGESPSVIASTAIRSATTMALPDFHKAQTPSVVSKSRTIALDSHEELAFPRAPGELGRRFKQNGSTSVLGQDLPTERKMTFTDSVSKTLDAHHEELTAQKIVLDSLTSATFEEICPFCLFILSSKDIRSEQKWREHVIGDLEAYVCLFDECEEPENMWTHSESWLKHMRKHALQWRCPAKSHRGQTFMTQQNFQNHLEQDHKKKYSDSELSLVISRSRQSTGPLFTSCPLCGEEVQQAGGKLEKHIAGHLRSLALKSLPPIYSEEDDEDEENATRSGGANSNRSTIEGISDMGSQGTFRTKDRLSSTSSKTAMHPVDALMDDGEIKLDRRNPGFFGDDDATYAFGQGHADSSVDGIYNFADHDDSSPQEDLANLHPQGTSGGLSHVQGNQPSPGIGKDSEDSLEQWPETTPGPPDKIIPPQSETPTPFYGKDVLDWLHSVHENPPSPSNRTNRGMSLKQWLGTQQAPQNNDSASDWDIPPDKISELYEPETRFDDEGFGDQDSGEKFPERPGEDFALFPPGVKLDDVSNRDVSFDAFDAFDTYDFSYENTFFDAT